MSTDRANAPISITLPPLPRLQDRFLAWAAIGVMIHGIGRIDAGEDLRTDELFDLWGELAESICRTEANDIIDHAAQVVAAVDKAIIEVEPLCADIRRQAISIITGKEQTDAF